MDDTDRVFQLFPGLSLRYVCAYWIGVSWRSAWGGSRDEGEVMIDNSAWSLSEFVRKISGS